jgi:hypothetical protein
LFLVETFGTCILITLIIEKQVISMATQTVSGSLNTSLTIGITRKTHVDPIIVNKVIILGALIYTCILFE